jgi:hypothetical protein
MARRAVGGASTDLEALDARGLLQLDLRPQPAAAALPERQMSRRTRWIVWGAAGVLVAAALGYLIPDQLRARDQFAQARTALSATQHRTRTVSSELGELRRDLSILETQVGSDTTALSQDSSQLLGVRTSLSAAQSHVNQQASLISSLHTCLGGVERALNALAVKNQPDAIAALNAVSASCTAAEASSG